MSVTFYVELPVQGYTLQCSCGDAQSGVFGTYADARAHLDAGNTLVCGDDFCAAYPTSVSAVQANAPEVNLSNVNARHILGVLGYETEDLCGSATADDLLGRILIAQAINPTDEGIPAVQEGNIVDCGRPEGYTDERLLILHDIVRAAEEHSARVLWS